MMIFALSLLACGEPEEGFGGAAEPETGGEEEPEGLSFAGARPTNLLMISWDTTRRDALSPYDTHSDHTPTVSALYTSGFVWEDHRSCSNWTYASVLCVQAAARGEELGFIPSTASDEIRQVPNALILGPEVLYAAGYQTALVSTNPWFTPESRLTQGIEHTWFEQDAPADQVIEQALSFWDSGDVDPDKPWYVHVHFLDPHIPYSPPAEYRKELEALDPIDFDLDSPGGHTEMVNAWEGLSEEEQALILEHLWARYRGELAFVDAEVGRFLEELTERGYLEDTLTVFWTDHGEQLFDHGRSGHSYDLYEDENLSSVIFSAPGLSAGRWEGPTTHSDLWPTVLDALQIPAPEEWRGMVFSRRSEDSPRFAQRRSDEPPQQMVELQGVKLLYRWDGVKELYHLSGDPGETEDLYDPDAAEVAALWELLLPEVEAMLAVWPDPEPVDPGP